MKLEDIPFEDEAFKAAVFASGETEAEAVTVIKGRKQSIKSVKGIEFLPNLTVLDLTRNRLTSLDLSHNTKLKQLFIGNNQLEELNLSGLTDLEGLEIFMNDIAELDLSNNPKLEVLYANANDFSDLDLSGNPLLADVQLNDNSLKNIELPEGVQFESFSAINNLFADSVKERLQQRISSCSPNL